MADRFEMANLMDQNFERILFERVSWIIQMRNGVVRWL